MLFLLNDGTLYPIFYILSTVHARHLVTILPELFLLSMLLILLLYIVFFQYNTKSVLNTIQEEVSKVKAFIFTIFALVFIFLIASWMLYATYANKGAGLLAFDDHIIMDYFSYIAKLVILFSAITLLSGIYIYFKQEKILNFEFLLIWGFSVVSLLFLISTFELVLLYFAIELLSLTLYILAMFRAKSKFSAEAGVKYITLGAIASGIMLYGISLLYGNLISLDFLSMKSFFFYTQDFPLEIKFNSSFFVGMLCMFIGFFFKIAAVPFHMWAIDVYEGVPVLVTAFFTLTVKFGVFWMFLRLVFYVFIDFISVWQEYFLMFGVFSIIIGTFGGIAQRGVKRLMAYSSINHVGYLLLGVSTGTFSGAYSVILYLLVYLGANLLFFYLLLHVYDPIKERRIVYISDFTSLGKSNPFIGLSFAMAALSLAGIPPLAGFFGKYYLFLALIDAKLYLYAIFAIASSVISSFYYLRIVKLLFFETRPTPVLRINPLSILAIILICILLFVVVFYFYYQLDLYRICLRAAHILMETFGFPIR